MNIEQILTVYDSMFGKYSLSDIEAYLYKNINEAKEKSEMGILFSLLNEMIGFCRDTTQREKALQYCTELLELINLLQLDGRIEYATSLINIANAYRAFGLCQESLQLYETVLKIYDKQIEKNDFRYASLYNNWALVYQEMEDYEKAREKLLKALEIVDLYEEAMIPQATTRTNLGASLIGMGTDASYEEAIVYLQQALDIFEKDGGKDFHYGAALVAMGDACSYKKEYGRALAYYKDGLYEIEKHTGKNDNYGRVLEKYNHIKEKAAENEVWRSNLERSRVFYETYGKEMIKNKFSEYENRIAVGMVGEGSDCFGFDDEISMDHDYEVGFCMWLTEGDYQKIGEKLQEEYDKIAKSNDRLAYRRGVCSINAFYNQILETTCDYEKKISLNYETLKEFRLAEATNGQVFRDDLGIFSDIRSRLLDYYPEKIWRRKLAQSIHEFSQFAQSNYARMMARKDSVSAMICVGKAIESVMDIMYLLERRYAPYYKWKKKGLENSKLAGKIFPILEKIAELPGQKNVWEGFRYSPAMVHKEDANVGLFEEIAIEILAELKEWDLVSGNEAFLEYYIRQIIEGKNMDIIENVIEEEWRQFDKVKNEGGRADCQDNYATFSIMRKSQYLTWTREMLESFYKDLLDANQVGWNLIMEKYARMMKSSNPEKYMELEKELPILSDKRIAIQEEIIKIQVAWMEAFAEQYPGMSQNARSIRTEEDNAFNTSYETYLRGELSTYSEKTFLLYSGFIVELLKEERNLAMETMANTAKLYGYNSLDDAEARTRMS